MVQFCIRIVACISNNVCRSMACDASVTLCDDAMGQHIANKTNDFPSYSRFFLNHF